MNGERELERLTRQVLRIFVDLFKVHFYIFVRYQGTSTVATIFMFMHFSWDCFAELFLLFFDCESRKRRPDTAIVTRERKVVELFLLKTQTKEDEGSFVPSFILSAENCCELCFFLQCSELNEWGRENHQIKL